jgi:hypothetical protein
MNLVDRSVLEDNPALMPTENQRGLGIYTAGSNEPRFFITTVVRITFRIKDKSVAKRAVFPPVGVTYNEVFGVVDNLGVDLMLGKDWINNERILKRRQLLFMLSPSAKVTQVARPPGGTQPSFQADFPNCPTAFAN